MRFISGPKKYFSDDALFVEKYLHPGDEVVDVWHLRQYVVADHEICLLAGGNELPCRLAAEEFDQRRDALGLGHSRHVGGWLDTEHRDLPRHEVLEQVTVVARELDDVTVGSETPPRNHLVGVAFDVLQPAVGVRREVGVLGKDLGRADVLFELNEEASLADEDMERVERLHAIELVGSQEGLAKRRHPEIHERVMQRCCAVAAQRCRLG